MTPTSNALHEQAIESESAGAPAEEHVLAPEVRYCVEISTVFDNKVMVGAAAPTESPLPQNCVSSSIMREGGGMSL